MNRCGWSDAFEDDSPKAINRWCTILCIPPRKSRVRAARLDDRSTLAAPGLPVTSMSTKFSTAGLQSPADPFASALNSTPKQF